MELCFATNNKHKLEEVQLAVGGNFIIRSLKDIGCNEDLPETQNTFEGNALQKAEYVFQKYKVPCFADDSGLEVDALKGAPGVYSARYAGLQRNDKDNLHLLLKNLQAEKNRAAQFHTVIALVGFGDAKFFDGIIRGSITENERGSNGFGYDPVFIPDGSEKTFAEMTMEEKNKFSHRRKATDELVSFLNNLQ